VSIDTVSIDTVSISPAARPGQLFRSLSWHGSWHEIWSYGRRPLYTVNRSTCTDGPDEHRGGDERISRNA